MANNDINITIPELTPEDFLQLYDIMKIRIDKGDMDSNEVISYFTSLLEESKNMKINPLVQQASYRNLTVYNDIS
jgi:chromatin segregation and condensation protein Rec8/ScpA/Scc1 (kleisin family)